MIECFTDFATYKLTFKSYANLDASLTPQENRKTFGNFTHSIATLVIIIVIVNQIVA